MTICFYGDTSEGWSCPKVGFLWLKSPSWKRKLWSKTRSTTTTTTKENCTRQFSRLLCLQEGLPWFLEGRGRVLCVGGNVHASGECGPAAFVLSQRDIIGRCHLGIYILRENYPLGMAECCITTELQDCSASALGS